jgi:hypothetical protein
MTKEDTARCFYTAMRTELNQHLLIINQIYSLYLGAATALFAGAFSSKNFDLLYLVPFLSFGAANLLGSHDKAISCIAAYCAEVLDQIFSDTDSHVTQWDNSRMLENLKANHYNAQLRGGLMIVVIPGVIALLVAIIKTGPLKNGIYMLALTCGLYFLVGAFLIFSDTAEYRRKMGGSPPLRQPILRLFSQPKVRILFPFVSEYSSMSQGGQIVGTPRT